MSGSSNTTSQPWKIPGYDPATDPLNAFGFLPHTSYGFTFTILFSLLTLAHLVLAVLSRRWWLLSIVAGGILEIVGWACRLWGAYNPDVNNAFLIETCTLIIGPVFFSGAIYAMLGWLITTIGPSYSLLRPKLFWRIFVTFDFVSLVLQAYGGATASLANTVSQSNVGTNIMEAGIVFQLVCTLVFACLFAHFVRGAFRDGAINKGDKAVGLVAAVAAGTAMVILRGIYRSVELAEGWHGFLILHEPFFMFDAVPMALCLVALAAGHPLWTLPLDRRPRAHSEARIMEQGELKSDMVPLAYTRQGSDESVRAVGRTDSNA